jgi:hypothetical protein
MKAYTTLTAEGITTTTSLHLNTLLGTLDTCMVPIGAHDSAARDTIAQNAVYVGTAFQVQTLGKLLNLGIDAFIVGHAAEIHRRNLTQFLDQVGCRISTLR